MNSVGMAKHFRDLLVAREPKTVELLEVGPLITALFRSKHRYLYKVFVTRTKSF